MTTATQMSDTGSVDSVAMSLLSMPEDDQTTTAPETAQADAETQAYDAGDDADQSSADDAGDASEMDETATENDGQKAPERHRVKINGTEQEVTLDDLKRSFAGQGYIQQRMQEVAAIRKEAEAHQASLYQERAQMAQALASYQQQLAAAGSLNPPSRDLLKTDPIRYLEESEAYREAVEQRQTLSYQQQVLAQQQQEQQSRAYQGYLAEQAQILTQRIPEFADAQKAGALKQSLIEVGTQYGFAPDELQAVGDARYVQVLHDAMRYRQMMASKDTVAAKVAQARPMVRPGVARTETDSKASAADRARSRMKSTGSVDDVASFLLKG